VLYYCIVVTVLTPQPRKPHTCNIILNVVWTQYKTYIFQAHCLDDIFYLSLSNGDGKAQAQGVEDV
jgi:hypothetical protein